MLKGHWHYIALGALFSALALKTEKTLISFVLFVSWLTFLYVRETISLPLIFIGLVSFLFFYQYLPSPGDMATSIVYKENERRTFVGKIVQDVKFSETGLSFTLELENSQDRLLVNYFYPQNTPNDGNESFPYGHGAKCKVIGELAEIKQATNPYEFDYRKYMHEQGIVLQVNVQNMADIKCDESKTLLKKLYDIRNDFIHRANMSLHPTIAAWQQALIFGNRDALDDDVEYLFQRWGLAHLLAISGLHVGIIVVIIYFLLIRLLKIARERVQLFVLLFLPVYAILAGGQPSVWRASLMISLVLLIKFSQTKLSDMDVLSIVFLLLIVVNRYIIFHVGFQFSFLVTFGLLLSKRWFYQATSNIERIFQISFIAQMMIVPLQMTYFYHFQPLSILLNVLIVPYFSIFVIPLMFFSILLVEMPAFFIRIFEVVFLTVHGFVMKIIELIDLLFNFPFVTGDITLTFALLYYALLMMMMIQLEANRRMDAFRYGVFLSLLLTFVICKPYFSKEGTVTLLDIGQGDAIIIELPHRKGVFFIDVGSTVDFIDNEPKETIYRRIIRPYLMGKGIQAIDGIFISHAHLDHHGSVRYILNDYPVRELFISAYYDESERELTLWKKHGAKVTKVNFLEKVSRNNQTFYVLAPRVDRQDENDNSLVLYTTFGNVNWLFTGDISARVERELVEQFQTLEVDILKIAHHGSKTSTSPIFVKSLQPKIAFIPVGERNRYGHPAKEVLETLEAFDVKLFRTDKDGAIIFKYNEGKESIVPFLAK